MLSQVSEARPGAPGPSLEMGIPPGAKAREFSGAFSAWLKPSPDTKPLGLGLCFPTQSAMRPRFGWGTQFWGELKETDQGLCFPTQCAMKPRFGWGTQFWGELKETDRGLWYPTLNAKCAFRMGHPIL